jgi:hypothetical protein
MHEAIYCCYGFGRGEVKSIFRLADIAVPMDHRARTRSTAGDHGERQPSALRSSLCNHLICLTRDLRGICCLIAVELTFVVLRSQPFRP